MRYAHFGICKYEEISSIISWWIHVLVGSSRDLVTRWLYQGPLFPYCWPRCYSKVRIVFEDEQYFLRTYPLLLMFQNDKVRSPCRQTVLTESMSTIFVLQVAKVITCWRRQVLTDSVSPLFGARFNLEISIATDIETKSRTSGLDTGPSAWRKRSRKKKRNAARCHTRCQSFETWTEKDWKMAHENFNRFLNYIDLCFDVLTCTCVCVMHLWCVTLWDILSNSFCQI